jgi:endoglycosylceramidase
MHQDVMSSNYGDSYDGVPKWLVDKYPPPENPYPWPLEEITAWEQGYLTQAASEGFQYLYDNANDSMIEWGQFWSAIASNFTGNPNVLGYNLINEPWIGDYFTNPNLTLSGVAAQINLVPSYDLLHDEIRRYDTEALILYEPVFYGQLREYPLRGSGFTEVPGGDDYQNVSAYSFHTYCWPLEFKPENATDDDIQERADYCETDFLPEMFEAAYSTVNRTGGGLILTEFGICKTWEDVVDLECDVFLRLADRYLMSWVDWDYNDLLFYDDNGDYIPGKVHYYTRPYPQATAGVPVLVNFNTTTLDFDFEYIIDTTIQAPTEIFVPQYHYSCGYEMENSPNVYTEMIGEDRIYLHPASPGVNGQTATFSLTKGASCP